MNWYKTAQEEENLYQIDKGILYTADGDEVFDMKTLIRLFPAMQKLDLKEIPKFRNAKGANEFLAIIEHAAGEKLGRVPDINYLELTYRDTNKEKNEAAMKEIEKRNEQWKGGDFVNWPTVEVPADVLSPLT